MCGDILTSNAEDRHDGVIITILYDPDNPDFSTKERLECLEEGRDGPFFGPEKHTFRPYPDAEFL